MVSSRGKETHNESLYFILGTVLNKETITTRSGGDAMADLDFQLYCIWNQLKAKLLGIPVRNFLGQTSEGRNPPLNLSHTFWEQPG